MMIHERSDLIYKNPRDCIVVEIIIIIITSMKTSLLFFEKYCQTWCGLLAGTDPLEAYLGTPLFVFYFIQL